jgi:hypothetical protein
MIHPYDPNAAMAAKLAALRAQDGATQPTTTTRGTNPQPGGGDGAEERSEARRVVTLDQLSELAREAIRDHSLCVDEDLPSERIIPPSLTWFIEDYLPMALSRPNRGDR